MKRYPKDGSLISAVSRAAIEIALLLLLLYTTRLMAEFTRTGGRDKGLLFALSNILTVPSFVIALSGAVVGCVVIEYLRKTTQ
jgi:hypothetical protein